jgi:hypothetical protein
VTSSSDYFRLLLDTRTWLALDLDVDGRVLAAHDDLGSLQLVEIGLDGTRTPLTDLPSRCTGRYVPGRRAVVVQHDQGGDENYQISLLDLTDLPASPVGLDGLTPVVRDEGHMNALLDVTESSVVYSTNRRNDVDMDVVVRRRRLRRRHRRLPRREVGRRHDDQPPAQLDERGRGRRHGLA